MCASGDAISLADEMEVVIEALPKEVQETLILGLTDTPSANRKMWKELEQRHPTRIWAGCMTHEVGLLLKDWARIPELEELATAAKEIGKWISNHDPILKLYIDEARVYYKETDHQRAAQKAQIGMYVPGETRMANTYRLMHRLEQVSAILKRVMTNPSYDAVAQAAMESNNKQRMNRGKEPKYAADEDGKFIDTVAATIQDKNYWAKGKHFLTVAQPALWLLRMVDGVVPCLGEVYYACCVVDKTLALRESQAMAISCIDLMRAQFNKRWKRWHRPIHTAAYAVDPSYHTHELTDAENAEVIATFKKLWPQDWLKMKMQLVEYRQKLGCFKDPTEVGEASIWEAVDSMHAWQWWQAVADERPELQKAGTQLTARVASASCCEFNWSGWDDVLGKKRTGLSDDRASALVRARATRKLKEVLHQFEPTNNLPTLADILSDKLTHLEAEMGLTEEEDCTPDDDEEANSGATRGNNMAGSDDSSDDDSSDDDSSDDSSDDDEAPRYNSSNIHTQ